MGLRVPLLGRTQLWKNYRKALAHGFLDAVEVGDPESFDQLRTSFDHHYCESKRLALEAIQSTSDPVTKMALSLQLSLWGRIPAWARSKASPEELGQINFDRQKGWRSEAATILSEVQKSGWDGYGERNAKAKRKIKSSITKLQNQLVKASVLQRASMRLSGKRRRIIREIMAAETKLQAVGV